MKHTVPANPSGEYVIRRGRLYLAAPSFSGLPSWTPLCWAAQRFDDLDSVTAAIFQLQELEAALSGGQPS